MSASNTSGLASGAMDSTYGASGKALVARPSSANLITFDIAVDAAGNSYASTNGLIKLDPSGGFVAIYGDESPYAGEYSPVVDGDGNVYSVSRAPSGAVEILKRDPHGELVAAFGAMGRAPVTQGLGISRLFRDASGNLYLLGTKYYQTLPPDGTAVVAKFDAIGRAVTTYGTDPNGLLPLQGIYRDPYPAATMDSAGNLYIVAVASGPQVAVRKFDANGRPSAEFGTSGTAVVPCAASKSVISVARSGAIFVGMMCGYSGVVPNRAVVANLDVRGNLVAGFGEGGVAARFFTPPATGQYGGATPWGAVFGIRANDDGTLYVAASGANATCEESSVLYKLGAGGDPVATFGLGGSTPLPLRAGSRVVFAMDGSARLYAGGETTPPCPVQFNTVGGYAIFRLGA